MPIEYDVSSSINITLTRASRGKLNQSISAYYSKAKTNIMVTPYITTPIYISKVHNITRRNEKTAIDIPDKTGEQQNVDIDYVIDFSDLVKVDTNQCTLSNTLNFNKEINTNG